MDFKEFILNQARRTAANVNSAMIIRRMIQGNLDFIHHAEESGILQDMIRPLIERLQHDNRQLEKLAKNMGIAHLVEPRRYPPPQFQEIPEDMQEPVENPKPAL